MVITYHGGQCIKASLGDVTLVFDPISKKATLPSVHFGADIVFVSRNHPNMNGISEVSFGNKKPFIINSPGEYEYKGILIRGYLSQSKYDIPAGDKDTVSNTIYVVEFDGMVIVNLGALSQKEIPREMREEIDNIDVLFVPIGGDGVLNTEDAYALATSLEPHIIIPTHWSGIGTENALKLFLKENGGAQEMDKVTLKKKDVLEQKSAIIVLHP